MGAPGMLGRSYRARYMVTGVDAECRDELLAQLNCVNNTVEGVLTGGAY